MSKIAIWMPEDLWINSQLSLARFSGGATIGGHQYIIVDKHGRDLLEATMAKDRKGSDKAIPPGEPADLLRQDFQKYYKKLGRDKFLEILKANSHVPDEVLKNIYKETVKTKKNVSK